MNYELIEKLKKNEKPLGLLSEEERELIKELNNNGEHIVDWYHIVHGWIHESRSWLLCNDKTYRIRPDWQPDQPHFKMGDIIIARKKDGTKWCYGQIGTYGLMLAIEDDEPIAYLMPALKANLIALKISKWTFSKVQEVDNG